MILRCVCIVGRSFYYLRHVCPSVCMLSAWLPLGGCPWNLILKALKKNSWGPPVLMKSGRKYRTRCMISECVLLLPREINSLLKAFSFSYCWQLHVASITFTETMVKRTRYNLHFFVLCLIYFLVYFSRAKMFEAWPWPTIFIHGGGKKYSEVHFSVLCDSLPRCLITHAPI